MRGCDIIYMLYAQCFLAINQGGIFIVPSLLCHVASVFEVSFGGQPNFIAFVDKQGVMGTYSDPGLRTMGNGVYSDPGLRTRGNGDLFWPRPPNNG